MGGSEGRFATVLASWLRVRRLLAPTLTIDRDTFSFEYNLGICCSARVKGQWLWVFM